MRVHAAGCDVREVPNWFWEGVPLVMASVSYTVLVFLSCCCGLCVFSVGTATCTCVEDALVAVAGASCRPPQGGAFLMATCASTALPRRQMRSSSAATCFLFRGPRSTSSPTFKQVAVAGRPECRVQEFQHKCLDLFYAVRRSSLMTLSAPMAALCPTWRRRSCSI